MPADAAHAAEVTRPRLLVCDDDAKVLESVRRLLLSRGFEAVTAQSGTAALEELARNSYDLLLLDLNMPDCDGYFVLDRIRAAQYDTAVVIVSGESSIDGAVDCLRRGAQDYLRKPYLPEDLFGRVETAWRERRLMRQHRLVQQQMRESERLHRFFVDNAPDFIYLVDTEGRFVYVNESVERLLGFTRDGLAGRARGGRARFACCTATATKARARSNSPASACRWASPVARRTASTASRATSASASGRRR